MQLQNLKLINIQFHEIIKYFVAHEVYKNICFEFVTAI